MKIKDSVKGGIAAAIVILSGIALGFLLFGCQSKSGQIIKQQTVFATVEEIASDYVIIYEANHYMYADTLYNVVKVSTIPGDYKTVITFEFRDKNPTVYSFPRLDTYILKQLSHAEN